MTHGARRTTATAWILGEAARPGKSLIRIALLARLMMRTPKRLALTRPRSGFAILVLSSFANREREQIAIQLARYAGVTDPLAA